MTRPNNRQPSVSYLYYFFLGLCLTAEPFFLKQFFAIYFPDFYYRALTVPISVVVGIVGFLKLKEVNGDTTIGQTVAAICQTYANLLNPEFWKKVLSYCPLCRVLPDLLMSPFSQEPAVHVRSKKAFKYFGWTGVFFSLLFVCVCYLFLINLPRWGLFETSLTTLFYLFWICLTGIVLVDLPKAIDAAKQLRNAKRSESDLNALLKLLRKELKGWQFKKRVVLPCADSPEKGDIDVVAISPDENHFVIELKSHIGKVTWNSELRKLCQQQKKDPEPSPLKRDFFDDVNKQAKLLRNAWNLPQFPNRVLIFWRAEVEIGSKKRLQRGVKISEKSRIVEDLEKRNRKLAEKKQNALLLKRNN